MGTYPQIQHKCWKNGVFLNEDCKFGRKPPPRNGRGMNEFHLKIWEESRFKGKGKGIVCEGALFPVDSWAPEINSPAIASHLSAFSLLPYMGFLYFITKSKSAPKLTLFGFYFLLAFVAAAIPAGIYAKVHYVTSLSNVDWLHGGAESLLMLTNLFIILGLRDAIRKAQHETGNTSSVGSGPEEEDMSSI